MKKIIVKCKACNFIMNKNKVGEICPACGLPKIVFEEFKSEVNIRRRFILELDLHPLAVHFTQAIGIGFMLIITSMILLDNPFKVEFLVISRWFCYFLPFSILFTIILGSFDAKIRFKKVLTPLLRLKIKLSAVLLFISCINFVLVYFLGIEENIYYFLGLSLMIVSLEAILGLIGSKLMHAILRG